MAPSTQALAAVGSDANLALEIARQAEALIGEVRECKRVAHKAAARQAREEGGVPLGSGVLINEDVDHALKTQLLRRCVARPHHHA